MKNLTRGKKIVLLVSAIVLVSSLVTGGVFGFKRHKAVKAVDTKATEATAK